MLFAAIQYNEYYKDPRKYSMWSLTSLSTFLIIYIISTIAFYMIFSTPIDDVQENKKSLGGSINIDPVLLRRIPDQIYTGFSPYNSQI